jgi:peptidoglycan-associated lipoprotein
MKQIFILALLTLSFAQMTFGQNLPEPKYIRKANETYYSGNYFEAIKVCQDAYKTLGYKGTIRQKGEMAYKIADSYRNMQIYDKANEWYGICIELKYFDAVPEVYFYRGDMQRMLKEYDNSLKSYREYKRIAPNSRTKELESAMSAIEKYRDFESEESNYVIKCETKINSKQYDMSPSFGDKKGKTIYFGTSRDEATGTDRDPISGQKYMDIFSAEYDVNGNPTNVKSIDTKGVVNTTQNEGTACFDAKKKKLYFTRCPNAEKMDLGCEIWTADFSGEDFDNPMKISLKTHDSVSVGHPCLTPDDMMLIFASDMTVSSNGEKSFGGRDLWYVTFDKRSKTWDSVPHNMGAMFNSAGNELFPSIGPKGQLYFASDGLPGIGGLDIFVAQREGDENKWSGTKNMGVPFNSQGNDYGMCDLDGRSGFFTSERKTSASNEYTSDIWSYSIPPNLYDLRVIVYESGKKSKKLAGAKVTVTVSDGTSWEGTTDAKGKVSWNEKPDKKSRWILVGKDYSLKAGKDGYYEDKRGAKFSTVGVDQSQTFVLEMPLLPIGEIRTPEVRYPVSQWTFINDATCMSLDSLKFLDSMLRENPNITIDLFSHTDARDTDTKNQVLSENRAKAVYKYLVEQKGIDSRRIRPVGKGESEPATWEDENGQKVILTEAYINEFKSSDPAKFQKLHQINRRTTAKITGTDFNPASAPPANPEFSVFKPLPK